MIRNFNIYKNIAIEFKKKIAELEQYPEPSMRAYMLSANDSDGDGIGSIIFDYNKFDEYNKQYESSNYYDPSQVPCFTARQANLYAPNEVLYFMLDDDPNDYIKVATVSKYYEQYLVNRKDDQTYIEYLEGCLAHAEGVIDWNY